MQEKSLPLLTLEHCEEQWLSNSHPLYNPQQVLQLVYIY